MDEGQLMNQQDDEIEAFMLGDDVILSSDMDHLIFSQEPEDKERLKSILIRAVANDDYGVINTLVNKGYQLDVINNKNQTITHLAYHNEHHPTKSWNRELVFFSGNNYKNYVDCNGLSLLHIACATDHVDVVKKFLDNGEDIHERLTMNCNSNRSGFTPLHFAVAYHRIDIVKLLLERGVNINAVDDSGSSPVHLICSVSSVFKKFTNEDNISEYPQWFAERDILKLLIEFDCDLSLRDNDGNTPLLRIYHNEFYYAPMRFDEIKGATGSLNAFVLSLFERQLEKFKILIVNRADITAKNYNDESLLHRVIKDLTSSRFSRTPVGKSVLDTHYVQIVKLLLESNTGFDVNAKTKSGETPISLAVSLMSYIIVEILLYHNADLNSIKIDGPDFFRHPNTVLGEDLTFNLKEIISTLISRGFKLTLHENLTIMKFLSHDVEDCDCGFTSRNEILTMETFQAIFFGPQTHLKRVLVKICASSNDLLKRQVTAFIGLLMDFCKLIPYSLSIDVETLEMLQQHYDPEVFQDLLQLCRDDIDIMKLTKLKNGLSLYDIVTKSQNISDSSLTWKYHTELSDSSKLFKQPFSYLLILSHSAKSIVRIFIVSSACNSYMSLIFPMLPVLCCKLILDYLDTSDILRLCEAAILE